MLHTGIKKTMELLLLRMRHEANTARQIQCTTEPSISCVVHIKEHTCLEFELFSNSFH
jgi:hypothetical protein